MSIKGIDAQMMVTRSAEAARSSAQSTHKNELFQNQMSALGKAQDNQESRTVVKTDKPEQAGINRDGEGGAGAYQDAPGQKKRKKDDPNELLSAGFAAEHKIDIKI